MGTGPSFTVYPETLERLPTAVHRIIAEELIRSGEWRLLEPPDRGTADAGTGRATSC